MQDGSWLDQVTLFGERFDRDHAIEVANFIVTFGIPLDASDMARFDDKIETIKEHFPAVDRSSGLHIQIGGRPGEPPPPPKELAEYGPNGDPRWTGEFGSHVVAVSSRAYESRDVTWPEANVRLNALLDCVDEFKPVRSIDYSVTDAFFAKTSSAALVCRNFFVANSHLPERLMQYDDPRWDISHGWFEHGKSGEKTLIRIDAKGVVKNDQTIFRLSNLNSYRPAKMLPLRDFRVDGNGTLIEREFDRFHIANKNFVKSVLNPELLQRMGLNGGEHAG